MLFWPFNSLKIDYRVWANQSNWSGFEQLLQLSQRFAVVCGVSTSSLWVQIVMLWYTICVVKVNLNCQQPHGLPIIVTIVHLRDLVDTPNTSMKECPPHIRYTVG